MRYRCFGEGLRCLVSACMAFGLLSATARIAESQSQMVKLDAYTGVPSRWSVYHPSWA
jgi:hypothetical protein